MTWARFDDGFPQHPKIVGLSDQAFRLHVSAVCYANLNLTDGVIHGPQLSLLLPGRAARAIGKFADELVKAGVWEQSIDGCWAIHDFLIYNKPRSEVMATRQANAKAGAIGAASRWHPGLNAPVPVPVPVPVPYPDPDQTQPDRARCYRAYENMAGSLTKTVIDRIDEWFDSRQDPEQAAVWVETACGLAAENEKRSWAYVKAILARWERDGFQSDTRPSKEPAGLAPIGFVEELRRAEEAAKHGA